jgi:hypothetical protein
LQRRGLGLGVVTGACDDDCSAIGTCASAAAQFGASIGIGFPAVPIMTAGANYDLCQVMGWKSSLHTRRTQAIVAFTAVAMCLTSCASIR